MPVLLTLLWWGWKERSWWRVILAGALLPYTYDSSAFHVSLLWFELSAAPTRCHEGESAGRTPVARPDWWPPRCSSISLCIAAHFSCAPRPVRSQGNPLGLYCLMCGIICWFWVFAETRLAQQLPRSAYAGPWEAFFFWLGVGMAVWRWQRRPAYRLLLLWLAVLILPAMWL